MARLRNGRTSGATKCEKKDMAPGAGLGPAFIDRLVVNRKRPPICLTAIHALSQVSATTGRSCSHTDDWSRGRQTGGENLAVSWESL